MRISRHITVTSQMTNEQCPIVDTAGIGGRKMRLPEEVSKATCSSIEKSAEVIVGTLRYRTEGKTAGVERTDKPEMPDREERTEGLNVMQYLMPDGSTS
jgi:hypothetical protein